MSPAHEISGLLAEYERALTFTDDLWRDLSPDEVRWRPHSESSAIGWHLGHQAHVAHFMIRNLTAAEPSPDAALDRVMDSATLERDRGDLPDLTRLIHFRTTVSERVRARIGAIRDGHVSAPTQLGLVAMTVMTALINHEYQHDQWIAEVRARDLGRDLPPVPTSDRLTVLDGYTVLRPS